MSMLLLIPFFPIEVKEVKGANHMQQVSTSEKPTIAIITNLLCEKLAVDAMIEQKTTFVRYKTEGGKLFLRPFCLPFLICSPSYGLLATLIRTLFPHTGESNVYTIGNIGPHRVISTKLPMVGRELQAKISSGSITTRLLGKWCAQSSDCLRFILIMHIL